MLAAITQVEHRSPTSGHRARNRLLLDVARFQQRLEGVAATTAEAGEAALGVGVDRLLAGGLPLRSAGVAYAAMHALVLGQAVLREAGRSTSIGPPGNGDETADSLAATRVAAYTKSEGRLVDVPLAEMIELLIAGIERDATQRR